MLRFACLAALVGQFACFNPSYKEGIACDEDDSCPQGMFCASDHRCRREEPGSLSDAPSGADPFDAPSGADPFDAPSGADPFDAPSGPDPIDDAAPHGDGAPEPDAAPDCGGSGEACCDDDPACDDGFEECRGGTCQSCGRTLESCCDPGQRCAGLLNCVGGLCVL